MRDMEAKLTKIALKDGAAVVQVKWTEAPGGANFITVATSSGLQVPRCTITVPLPCPTLTTMGHTRVACFPRNGLQSSICVRRQS